MVPLTQIVLQRLNFKGNTGNTVKQDIVKLWKDKSCTKADYSVNYKSSNWIKETIYCPSYKYSNALT